MSKMYLAHRRSVRLLALALGTTIAITATAQGVTASAVTTSSVIAAAKVAIAKQTSVRLVAITKSGSVVTTGIDDIGTYRGTETISAGAANVTIKVTPTYAYMSGSSSGLTTIAGLTAAQAHKVGKDWISIKAGTTPYASLKSDVTTAGLANIFPAVKGTTLSTTVTNGTELYVLKWTTAATSSVPTRSNTFTFTAAGETLPVEDTVTTSSGSGTTTFSKWGETVVVNAPPVASTIAYSTVMS